MQNAVVVSDDLVDVR